MIASNTRRSQIRMGLRAGILAGVIVVFGLTAGCSRNSAADTEGGAQPAPRRTTTQAAEAIKNDSSLSPTDKDKYLRQLKENEMAERMNPNASAPNNSGPPPGPAAGPK